MKMPSRILLTLFVICFASGAGGDVPEKCPFDFYAELSVQVLNSGTQMPIDNELNSWNGLLVVREGWLMDVELSSYRVDLQFKDIGHGQYEVGVVLQERASPLASAQSLGQSYEPSATYEPMNSTALKFEGAFGKPLVIRPELGDVTLALTLYSHPKEA